MINNVNHQKTIPEVIKLDEPWDPLESLNEFELPDDDYLDPHYMEDLGMKTREVIQRYNLPGFSLSDQSRIEGEEVGDDRLDISNHSGMVSAALVAQTEIIHMKTSQRDTFISKNIWNFCEVTGLLPAGQEESFHHCRKVNGFKNLGFVDVPPLRIILDVSKGDRSHSSTPPGKMTMLASRTRTPRSEFEPMWSLASFLQDGLLATNRATEPKYLPQIMGGSGARAPFGEPLNLYLFVAAYRGGKYSRVYGTATKELYECVRNLNIKDYASTPVFSYRLRDKQEYLHGTFAEKVFIPTYNFKNRMKESALPEPIIVGSGGSNRFGSYQNRLVRTKHLVTRRMAEREFEYSTRIRDQIFSSMTIKDSDSLLKLGKLRGRKNFDFALNANSAFRNLLDRNADLRDVNALLGDEDFTHVNVGVTEFTMDDAQWLASGGKFENFSIEDLGMDEDLFVRTEVSEEETYKVGNIPLNPIRNNVIVPGRTRTDVGLYQINSTQEEWSEDLLTRLQSLREDGKPVPRELLIQEFARDPEWVNDDTLIISKCLQDSADLTYETYRVLLVSQDKRLANQLAETCNVQVLLMDPTDYIVNLAGPKGIPLDKPEISPDLFRDDQIDHRGRKDPIRKVYLDIGSIAASAAKLHDTADTPSHDFMRKTVIESGYLNGKRFSRYTLQAVPASDSTIKTKVYTPVLRNTRRRFAPPGGYPKGLDVKSLSDWRSNSSSKSQVPRP